MFELALWARDKEAIAERARSLVRDGCEDLEQLIVELQAEYPGLPQRCYDTPASVALQQQLRTQQQQQAAIMADIEQLRRKGLLESLAYTRRGLPVPTPAQTAREPTAAEITACTTASELLALCTRYGIAIARDHEGLEVDVREGSPLDLAIACHAQELAALVPGVEPLAAEVAACTGAQQLVNIAARYGISISYDPRSKTLVLHPSVLRDGPLWRALRKFKPSLTRLVPEYEPVETI